jgi:MoaA/NifB/PqqE/SkfB family radical SAM enzyme
MTKYPSKTWCAYPFSSLVFHNNGTYGPCCSANEAVSTDLDDDEIVMKMHDPSDKREFKVFSLTAKEAFNSEFMKDIRQKMMNGEKPTACSSCWRDESIGIKSKRQGMNEFYLKQNQTTSVPSYNDGGFDYDVDEMVKKPRLRSLDLKFNNKCNLHCLMCSSGSSDMWVPLDNKIHNYLTLHNVSNDDTDLYHDESHTFPSFEPGPFPGSLFEEIKLLVPQLQEIQCTGGEPFINSHFIELLNYIIDTGHAEHISLEITTNGTKFVTEVMELLTHFRHIRFLISIDGTNATYDYIRAPYRYDLLLKRLKTLDEYFLSGKIRGWAEISAVAMSYNIFDFQNLSTIVEDLKYEHFQVEGNVNFTMHNIDNPLHIKWLPDKLMNEALEYYKSSPTQDRHMRSVIEKFEGYINNNKIDKETKLYNQRRMKNYTVLMDKTLNRDYHDYLDPRICEFLDTVDCDVI